jgi:hypothetical protein
VQCTVPDFSLCLGVLKHRAPLARWPIFLPNNVLYDGYLLKWCNFKFEVVLFRNDSKHNDRFDCLWECATKQAAMTVAQWHRNQIIRGLLVIDKHHCLHILCPCSYSRSRLQARLLIVILSWYFVWCILSLKVTGKVTDSDTVLIFCLMYSQSQGYRQGYW